MQYLIFVKGGKNECFYVCGDICLDKKQICDGHAHCIDGADEVGCGMRIFKLDKSDNCHFPYKIKCKDEAKCYSISEMCDGFNDCSKKTDEIYCENYQNVLLNQTCKSRFYVTCSNSPCIPIDKYCVDSNKCLDENKKSKCGKYLNIINI